MPKKPTPPSNPIQLRAPHSPQTREGRWSDVAQLSGDLAQLLDRLPKRLAQWEKNFPDQETPSFQPLFEKRLQELVDDGILTQRQVSRRIEGLEARIDALKHEGH